jgi:hypothetical protein
VQSEAIEIKRKLPEAKGNPQKTAVLMQSTAVLMKKVAQQMNQRYYQYTGELSVNYQWDGRGNAREEYIRINESYGRDMLKLLELAEQLRETLVDGRALTPEDEKYAALLKSTAVGNQFPTPDVVKYLIALADRTLPSKP